MKCPKCHKEVEKGSLYCPYCLSEIPWVREFDTVETLMKKKQQNRSSEKKHKSKIIKYFGRRKRKKLKFSKKQLLCLFLCALILTGFFCYLQLNTFSALYSRACICSRIPLPTTSASVSRMHRWKRSWKRQKKPAVTISSWHYPMGMKPLSVRAAQTFPVAKSSAFPSPVPS